MSTSYFDTKLSVLMKEWDYCQTHIGRFDTIIFGIRGWAVSAFTAVLAVSVTQKLPILMLFAVIPITLFWIIDAVNKNFQRRFSLRTREIESYFRSDEFRSDIEVGIPVISVSFRSRPILGRLTSVARAATQNNVMIVYLSIVLLCLISYVLLKVSLYGDHACFSGLG
jgi:uncharacterized membrane protein